MRLNKTMEGNVFDVKRFAVHDGPGIRTTVFLKGCPLKCKWCHNPEGISPERQLSFLTHKCVNCGACANVCPNRANIIDDGIHKLIRKNCTLCGECVKVCFAGALKLYGVKMTACEVAEIVLEDRDFYRNSGGGLTVSGGEPLLQPEFIGELFSIVKGYDVHTAVDVCGAVPWSNIEKILDTTDLFLYDLKHPDPQAHKEGTGKDNILILENLRRLSDCGKSIEVRIPLIPGYNDTEENLRRAEKILSEIKTLTKTVILPYNDYARTKYTALDMPDTMPIKI